MNKFNIISGPGPRDYFYHSPGALTPLVPEEGPFPVQGNIGQMLTNEAKEYKYCDGEQIGGGPNCTGYFIPDAFTTENTCGKECKLGMPELIGMQNFGYSNGDYSNNSHSLHTYQLLRAGSPGKQSTTGCIEWIPNVSSNNVGSCELNARPEYRTTGQWNMLPQYSNLQTVKYK